MLTAGLAGAAAAGLAGAGTLELVARVAYCRGGRYWTGWTAPSVASPPLRFTAPGPSVSGTFYPAMLAAGRLYHRLAA